MRDLDEIDNVWLGTLIEDTKIIAYRPTFRRIAGSVAAAILLQQILYRWVRNNRQPFYKYKEPCDAADYREGDSWCEELAFSREEFDTALKHIAQKVTREKPKGDDALVWYRVTPDRKTWYEINYAALRKAAFPLYVSGESHATCRVKPALPILYTESITEITNIYSDQGGDRAIADAPPPPPTAPAVEHRRMKVDEYDHPLTKVPSTPPSSVAPSPSRRPLSARVDGRKFKGGRIPAGQGANAVEVFYERHSINETRLSAPKEDDLLKAVTDLGRWRDVVVAWEQSDYKPTNIKGQLDWYRDGIPERNGSAGNGTGFGLTAYAEKERKRHERDYGPDEELTPEKEQWIWEQKRKLAERNAQNPGV